MKKSMDRVGKKVHFAFKTEPGSQVYVAGTFNNWDPTTNPLKDNPDSGHCKVTLHLHPGRYEYKFIVNGEWLSDPECAEWAPNGQGGMNSVLHV